MNSYPLDNLQTVQRVRKAVLAGGLVALIALAVLSRSVGGDEGMLHEGVEAVGLALIAVCIVGRAWCSLYIGGRKKVEIVQTGPYSVSRNPLYVFSFVGAAGVGAQTGSLIIATAFVLLTWLVFNAVVSKEEAWLGAAFGAPYAAYLASTSRFWPSFRLWRDDAVREVRPAFFLLTLRDGLVFLLAVPAFEALDRLHDIGWLKPLWLMP